MPEYLYSYRWQIAFLLLGLIFLSVGVFLNRSNIFQQTTVEIVEDTSVKTASGNDVIVEVTGSVDRPDVYTLSSGSRVDDAITMAGGITEDANIDWMNKYLNRAAPLIDGQKIYIPSQSEVLSANDSTGGNTVITSGEGMVNINTASQSELEELWGIGPATAQNIIEQRLYTSVEELLSKGILKQNVYDRNRDLLTIY